MNINDINLDNVTIDDCMELLFCKNITTVIYDGKIIGFVKE